MPQMAPISWLFMFIVFSITLVIFNTLNYFSCPSSTPKTFLLTKSSNPSMNWKW